MLGIYLSPLLWLTWILLNIKDGFCLGKCGYFIKLNTSFCLTISLWNGTNYTYIPPSYGSKKFTRFSKPNLTWQISLLIHSVARKRKCVKITGKNRRTNDVKYSRKNTYNLNNPVTIKKRIFNSLVLQYPPIFAYVFQLVFPSLFPTRADYASSLSCVIYTSHTSLLWQILKVWRIVWIFEDVRHRPFSLRTKCYPCMVHSTHLLYGYAALNVNRWLVCNWKIKRKEEGAVQILTRYTPKCNRYSNLFSPARNCRWVILHTTYRWPSSRITCFLHRFSCEDPCRSFPATLLSKARIRCEHFLGWTGVSYSSLPRDSLKI